MVVIVPSAVILYFLLSYINFHINFHINYKVPSSYQKPIRVETCNARSQLPNIQCELIGGMFQC